MPERIEPEMMKQTKKRILILATKQVGSATNKKILKRCFYKTNQSCCQ